MKTIPYTYLVKHVPSGRVYYGSHSRKGCSPDDLFRTYFTSSKRIHALLDVEGPDAFQYEIRKTFDCPQKCRAWEYKVLQRMKVDRDHRFFNIVTMKHIKTGMMTGKRWITNGSQTRVIEPDVEIPEGWYRGNHWNVGGKKDHTKGTIWINRDGEERCHPKDEPIPDGWVKGRAFVTNLDPMYWKGRKRPDHAAKIAALVWCTDGNSVRRFPPDAIPQGFIRGRKTRAL